jgi:hypothetical protein
MGSEIVCERRRRAPLEMTVDEVEAERVAKARQEAKAERVARALERQVLPKFVTDLRVRPGPFNVDGTHWVEKVYPVPISLTRS